VATVRTVTVKGGGAGGDYTTLASAEAGEQGDLVSLDRQLNIECFASAAGDSTAVAINGWTCDATRYIDIYAPVGERHAGVWNTGKYYLEMNYSASGGGIIRNQEAYTRVRYLQVRNTNGSPAEFNSCIYDDTSNDNMLVDGCITRGGWAGVDVRNGGTSVTKIRNHIAYGGLRGVYATNTSGNRVDLENCTLIGTTYGISNGAAGTYRLWKNVYAHGGTTCFHPSGGTATKTNCMSSDTTATNNSGGGGATNCTNSVAHSTANFTNVTGGSESYLLPSGSALIDAGVDLSGTFTNDIDGTTRPQNSVFDVGADEYAAAPAGGQPTWKRFGGCQYFAMNPGIW
jgi:hypothetical protein